MLLPELGENDFWFTIVGNFFDRINNGEFENEVEVIHYIEQNPIIDLLMISILKNILPFGGDDDSPCSSFGSMRTHHRAMFQAICNEFDLALSEDHENSTLNMYLNSGYELDDYPQAKNYEVSEGVSDREFGGNSGSSGRD